MKGICGLWLLNNQLIEPIVLRKMARNLTFTEPDHTDIWHQKSLGMAQVSEESIITEGSLTLVADARIDNRQELFERLNVPLEAQEAISDYSLILMAYTRFSDQTPKFLLGDFVFAIWDARTQSLFCARDHTGQRILHYYHSSSFFAFGSGVRSLLALPQIPKKLNEDKLADFLTLCCSDPKLTFYQNVFRLPPGQTLTVTKEGISLKQYWSPEDIQIRKFSSEQACIDEFRHIFEESVRCRMRDGLVGAHLSGGLDSSSVASVAANLLKPSDQKLLVFGSVPFTDQVGYLGPGCTADDSAYMQAVCDHSQNMELVKVATDRTPEFGLNRFYEYNDSPFFNPCNRPWMETILEEGRKRGLRAMLTGAMGNMTISWKGAAPFELFRESKRMAKSLFSKAVVPLNLKKYAQPWSQESIISTRFAKKNGLANRYKKYSRFTVNDKNARIWMLWHSVAQDTAASYNTHRAIYGIECRDPTHDKRIVDFCLSVPNDVYCNSQHTRLLVRKGMEGIVPPLVLERTSLGRQAADWIHGFDRLRGFYGAQVKHMTRSKTLANYIDLKQAQDLLSAWHLEKGFLKEAEFKYRIVLQRGLMTMIFVRWMEENYGSM